MASDSFTGADGTVLSTHDANWSKVSGADLKIYSNQLSHAGWAGAGAYRRTDSAEDKSEVKIVATSEDVDKGPCVRMGASSHGYRAFFTTPSGGNWTRIAVSDDVGFFAYVGTTFTYAQASDWYMRIEASGTSPVTLKVYVGSTAGPTSQAGTDATDSDTPITSGNPGLYIPDSGTTENVYLDDWTDGASGGSSGGLCLFLSA
jgi:hypothetical protein